MNDYYKQAQDFLNDNNITFTIKSATLGESRWSGGVPVHCYVIQLKNKDGNSMQIDFYDSIVNSDRDDPTSEEHLPELKYSVLASLDPYFIDNLVDIDPEYYEELCNDFNAFNKFLIEYGYEVNNENLANLSSTYLRCIEQCIDIHEVFNEKQREELAEIQ